MSKRRKAQWSYLDLLRLHSMRYSYRFLGLHTIVISERTEKDAYAADELPNIWQRRLRPP